MQYNQTIVPKNLLYKRIYGVIALLLLFTFTGRVAVVCINDGTCSVKSQQVIPDGNHEQDDKQEEGKFDNKKLTEFISPANVDLHFLPLITFMGSYPLCLVQFIEVPVITVITPPPDSLYL